MAVWRRCMGGSLRCASLYSNGAGAEGKSHRFAGGSGAVLTAVTNQDGRRPVKTACVKGAEGDSPQDIVEMHRRRAVAAPRSGVRRYRACVDLWAAVRVVPESSMSKRTDMGDWLQSRKQVLQA